MWELITEDNVSERNTLIVSHRLKVPKGWLVRTVTSRYHGGAHAEQTFVEDLDHSWELKKID